MASEETLEAVAPVEVAESEAPDAWKASMVSVMRKALLDLPEDTTLGEIVAAARANPQMSSILGAMSIQQLIDIAVERPLPLPAEADEEADSDSGIGAAVIRRRSEVPDGDLTVLRCLSENGPMAESQICRTTRLSTEQVRLIMRGMRTDGYMHSDGIGPRRKLKITRAGSTYLAKKSGQKAPARARRRRRRG